jgi:UDP-2,3-diacylglucosamine hydrolase
MADHVIVVSDIHLGAVPRTTERAFRRFLDGIGQDTAHLLINGDLFDFWFEYRTVIQAEHYRVLAALTDLVERGVRVSFVGGNHDAWGGDFLREEVGIELLEDASVVDLAGWRTLVVHGDGRGHGDLGYRWLRRFIRNPITVHAFRQVHPDWGSRIARLVSTTEAKIGAGEEASAERAAQLQRWAERQLAERDEIDLVVAGHTHTPLVAEVGPNRFYVNTGDWINHFTYLTLCPDSPPRLDAWTG